MKANTQTSADVDALLAKYGEMAKDAGKANCNCVQDALYRLRRVATRHGVDSETSIKYQGFVVGWINHQN